MNINILFSCAGRRTYLLKYFRRALAGRGSIVATDMQLSAPALSAADIVEQVPAVYAANYIDVLLSICKRHDVGAIISLNDLELPILAARRELFEEEGICLIVSPPEVIDICFDKYRTAQFVESLGISAPKTFINYREALTAIDSGELRFPLVLKPRWGSGSIGIEFVDDIEELETVYHLLLKKIKKSILGTASVGEEYILIQEKIEGPEYGLDVMNDLNGHHVAVSVKRKLSMRAGETDKAITVDNSEVHAIGTAVGRALHHVGNLDCDVLERDGHYYLLELNPRFGGGYPFSQEAGVDMPRAIIEWLLGNEVDPAMLAPKYGLTFAKCDYLVAVGSASNSLAVSELEARRGG